MNWWAFVALIVSVVVGIYGLLLMVGSDKQYKLGEFDDRFAEIAMGYLLSAGGFIAALWFVIVLGHS